MKGIMKIVESTAGSSLLIKCVTQAVANKP